jgi:excinuclease ABC subunit C
LADLLEGTLMVPKKGDKAKLVHLAKENAILHHQNNMDAFLRKVKKTTGAMSELATLLGLEEIRRIEAFDNSHTMGSNQVSAMVVFIDGSPENKSYRKYLNKTAGKADDYHQMQEVIYRRYQRLLVENGVGRPDLIVMDGGIAQVHAAKEILDSLYLDIPVIGLKKDDFHKTDAIIGLDETAIKLDRHSDLYILLTKIQDEAHRFAITFHREKQGKQIYASMLDAVPGIGAVSKQKLLETFKTLDNIKKAEDDALKAIGLKKPQIENLRIALMGKTVQEKK